MSERSEGGSRAEWVGVRSVSERNGGDSRSGVNELQTSEGAEMGVNPAEATEGQWQTSMRVGNNHKEQ